MDCNPSDLANAAKCFQSCIPDGMQAAIQTYLLAQIAAVTTGTTSTDPKALMLAATTPGSSFLQLDGMQAEVQTYLLCAIANASGA